MPEADRLFARWHSTSGTAALAAPRATLMQTRFTSAILTVALAPLSRASRFDEGVATVEPFAKGYQPLLHQGAGHGDASGPLLSRRLRRAELHACGREVPCGAAVA